MSQATSRDSFICDNMGLVHTCAKRFDRKGIDYDDLFQAGCVGLIKAADGFDPSRGLCFSTYAVPLILGEIRHLFREGGAVKVSRSLRSLSYQVARLRESLIAQNGREPTVEQLARELELEPAVVAQAVCVASPTLSLTCDEDEGQWDLPTDSYEEAVTDRVALQQVLEGLDPQDRELIRLRYLCRQTQQATADRLGMTQVQVSRRERALLLTMREKLTL